MTAPHAFDSHLDTARRWLTELGTNLNLSPTESARALHALRAGLHAIRDRMTPAEVLDLGAQLPALIRGFYFEGWTLHAEPRQIRDRDAMIARVNERLGPDQRLAPVDVLRAVIHLLVQHVSPGEIEDMLATFPISIRDLWHELSAPPQPPADEPLTRRTGYSR